MIPGKMNRLLSAALFLLLLASPALAAPTALVNGKIVTVNADFAIAEAMLAIVLLDHALRHRAQNALVQCSTPVIPGSVAG